MALAKYGIKYKIFPCDPKLADTAAFCERYGFKPEQSLNTIIVASKKVEPTKYAACTVLATSRLDVNKKVCKLLGVKRASFASADDTIKQTGMMIGGVTVFGLEDMPVYIESGVFELGEIIMGGGDRSNKVILNSNELKKLPNVEVINDLVL